MKWSEEKGLKKKGNCVWADLTYWGKQTSPQPPSEVTVEWSLSSCQYGKLAVSLLKLRRSKRLKY